MGIFIYSLGMTITLGSVVGMWCIPSALWTSLCAIGTFTCYVGGMIKGSEK